MSPPILQSIPPGCPPSASVQRTGRRHVGRQTTKFMAIEDGWLKKGGYNELVARKTMAQKSPFSCHPLGTSFRKENEKLNIKRVGSFILFFVFFAVSTGVSQFEEVPDGLELLWAKVTTGEKFPEFQVLIVAIAVRNISDSDITILTENLQDDLVNYKDWPDKPWEIHIDYTAFQMENDKYIIPPLSTFSPVTLKPGGTTTIKHSYKDHENVRKAIVVFDMFSPVNDQYHTWRGRLRSDLLSVKHTKE